MNWVVADLVRLAGCSASTHYLNQGWLVSWFHRNIVHWSLTQNAKCLFEENAFENAYAKIPYTMGHIVSINANEGTYTWYLYWYRTPNARILTDYNYVIMGAMESQITSLAIVYTAVNSDADQRKHQSSASLAFVRGIHRGPVNSPHKGPVTRKMVPFDDVIMCKCVGTKPAQRHQQPPYRLHFYWCPMNNVASHPFNP